MRTAPLHSAQAANQPTALIIGGNGLIGSAAAIALTSDGWSVRVLHRGSRPLAPSLADHGVTECLGDRADDAVVAAAIGAGADLVVDCVGYHGGDAAQLLEHAPAIGAAVVISSAAVYADSAGNFLGSEEFPDLPVPVREEQPTAAPGRGGYAEEKVELEQAWLASPVPATILRPGAIHGRYAENPREWFAVKRALDGREDVVLSFGGESRFHTSAAVNIAELIRLAARQPADRVLNAVDPECLTVGEIVRAVYAHLSREVTIHSMAADAVGNVGRNPWAVPRPMVLDMSAAAEQLGYRAVAGYAEALPPYVDWLVETTRGRDWREALPVFVRAQRECDLFDYASEDAWLASAR